MTNLILINSTYIIYKGFLLDFCRKYISNGLQDISMHTLLIDPRVIAPSTVERRVSALKLSKKSPPREQGRERRSGLQSLPLRSH